MSLSERIAAAVKAARKAKGWPQKALADKAGMRQSHLSSFEAGKRGVSLQTLDRICVALGVDMRELIGGAVESVPVGAAMEEAYALKAKAFYFASLQPAIEVAAKHGKMDLVEQLFDEMKRLSSA